MIENHKELIKAGRFSDLKVLSLRVWRCNQSVASQSPWSTFLEYKTGNSLYHSINTSSPTTIIYFFSGTTILLYFDWFCKHIKWIFPFCLVYMIITFFLDYSFLYYIEPLIFSAIIVAIAYFCKPLNFLQKYDNISYGLYLYHFPVIQVLVQYKLHQYNIYLTFMVTLLITVLIAIASWYIIEKPMLQRKIT